MKEMENISIVQKPDWVSWDEIHDVLAEAHAENRKKGVIVAYSVQEGDQIRGIIEDSGGALFVALDGKKVVGTAGVELKQMNEWYCHGTAAFYIFAAILPAYRGQGIYKKLMEARDAWTRERVPVIVSATHYHNKRVMEVLGKTGFRKVWFKAATDHYNVFWAKWIGGKCPYPDYVCRIRYCISRTYGLVRYRIDPQKGRVKRFGI